MGDVLDALFLGVWGWCFARVFRFIRKIYFGGAVARGDEIDL